MKADAKHSWLKFYSPRSNNEAKVAPINKKSAPIIHYQRFQLAFFSGHSC